MQGEEKDLSSSDSEPAETASGGAGVPESNASPAVPRARRWLIACAVVISLIAFGFVLFDWNMFKGYAERRISAATGREFHIDGDIHVRLSMNPLITMDRLRLGNPRGAREPTMASVQRLQLQIALWPLLRGQTVLPEVHLVKPVVRLEKYANGSDNWTFPGSGENPVIRKFTVDQGVLAYREDKARTNLVVGVDSEKPAATGQLAPLQFRGKGSYRNNPFALRGTADSPLALSSTSTPYRIDIDAVAGSTHAHASGALRNPLQVTGFDLDFTLSGPDLGLLYRLIGVATPETPPYRLRGRLGHAAHVWTFNRFSGVIGNSDLAGDVSVDDGGRRKSLRAVLVSRRLDVHDLAGFVGAPAHANPAKASTPQQQAEAERAAANPRLLPQKPYDLDRLRGMDADVSLRARQVIGTKVPLDALYARMVITDGVVRLDPFDFGAADGQVRSTIGLDASRPVIASSAKIRLRNVDLGKLVPEVPAIRRSAGKISADIDLRGSGNSIAGMLGTSNGSVRVGMGAGRISDLLMAYAGLDIARIIKLRITGDHDIAIRCVVGDLSARSGIWTTKALVFDSADTVIRGSGDIDMRNETFDLLLKVRPKNRSLLSLRSPLRASGSFRNASIKPDIKALGIRGIAAAVLGGIAPPAAELALIEYGGGKDSQCLKTDAAPAR